MQAFSLVVSQGVGDIKQPPVFMGLLGKRRQGQCALAPWTTAGDRDGWQNKKAWCLCEERPLGRDAAISARQQAARPASKPFLSGPGPAGHSKTGIDGHREVRRSSWLVMKKVVPPAAAVAIFD